MQIKLFGIICLVVAKWMWFYHWCWEINELLKNSILELLPLFCCLLWQFPECNPCPIKHLALRRKVESI